MWPFGRKRLCATPPGDAGAAPKGAGSASADALLGRRGEKLACKFLKRLGLKILATNYRCPSGEADIIALDASTFRTLGTETIVFVEVKTRSDDRYTSPQSAVNDHKRRQLRKVARYYLSSKAAGDLNVRYDIVAIVASDGQEPRIEHITDVQA